MLTKYNNVHDTHLFLHSSSSSNTGSLDRVHCLIESRIFEVCSAVDKFDNVGFFLCVGLCFISPISDTAPLGQEVTEQKGLDPSVADLDKIGDYVKRKGLSQQLAE